MMRTHGPLLFLLLFVQAQAQTIAITGATVHTMTPNGTLEKATVIIEDGMIAAVGRTVAVPNGAERIDASGKVVTPGFMDAYSHLGLVEITLVEETLDAAHMNDRFSAAYDVIDAFNPHSTLISINRIEGVTRAMAAPTTRDESLNLITGQGALVDLSGRGDSILRPRAAMFAVLGETGATLSGGSRATAMLRLREALQDSQDYSRNRSAWENGARHDYAVSRLDLEALQPVLDGSVPLVIAVERASDIQAVMRLADDFDIRVIVLGGGEAWMVAEELAAADVGVILDPLQNLPSRFERIGARLDNAALLDRAGVRIVFATGNIHNSRNLKQVAGNAVAHGLPYQAALGALTTGAAALYGMENRYGTLEPGVDADVVIWDGDPLEVTTFADLVFIRGERIPMESRQTKLRDRYLDLNPDLPHAYTKP